ncbi:extracellular matrix protein 1-like isoform X1 [Girardinichthys multiradiatus]|uniref:extracellular matrix protein 1-like isoform X1 n=1 Tax=Girardinichthys multiradiatus TaxID=208333 RepID=UPI001FACF859|nr:extracellular matrix protein 1-like isoform X1 [Girardinichthys multiradiatus]
MDSFWALVCAAASVLVLRSSACKDAQTCLQREVTISHGQGLQEPDLFPLQREVDLSELLNPEDFPIMQEILKPQRFEKELSASEDKPPPRSWPSFGPRSFPPAPQYAVQFPLGQPTPDNIQAICVHADHRPRYPDSYFPPSGFGKQKRMATAVNNAESWFSTCCKGNETWGTEGTLCCATQAWQHSVELFCEEDSSVKDRLYDCCRRTGVNRLSCFNDDAPNPSYKPTEELPVEAVGSVENFRFSQNTCPRSLMIPQRSSANKEKTELNPATSQKINIGFPPGRPTADNILSLCINQRLRPLYTTKCLPSSGYELLARQVKTINRLEKKFKQCCKKKGALNCAEQKWREELNGYCSARNSGQVDHQCCQENDQHSCFQSISSDPLYNVASATEAPSLNNMCDAQIINNRFPVGFQLKTLCCPLSEQDRNTCFAQKLEQLSQSLCSSNKSASPAVRRCCKLTPQEIPQCFSKNVMEAITKAINKGQKKKKNKICPIP